MMRRLLYLLLLVATACTSSPQGAEETAETPKIYPDYVGVTIPAGIAPLAFDYVGGACDRIDVVVQGSKGGTIHCRGKNATFPIKAWHKITAQNKGGTLTCTVAVKAHGQWTRYAPFDIFVSTDTLAAAALTYRRIAPGYEVYGQMGIYERDISTYRERALIENSDVPGACFNCHTNNGGDTRHYTFHIRGDHGGTYIHSADEGDILLAAVNDSIGGALVYPSWHPSGRYCAFSTNTTRQGFHAVRDERVEVFDQASAVLIYDVATATIIRDSIVGTSDHYETYPVFSPDGKTLYFCSALAEPIPERYREIRYALCSIAFDADSGQLVGGVDTLFAAPAQGKSAIHPRVSPDGRFLMFTLADYGCFPIWHKEADNWLLNLSSRDVFPLTAANSPESDSWHNYSPDGHWFVFTSRRDDGLYTRLYLCHIDSTGTADKPFMLPQKEPRKYYDALLYSYNTPAFAGTATPLPRRKVAHAILSKERRQAHVKETR